MNISIMNYLNKLGEYMLYTFLCTWKIDSCLPYTVTRASHVTLSR